MWCKFHFLYWNLKSQNHWSFETKSQIHINFRECRSYRLLILNNVEKLLLEHNCPNLNVTAWLTHSYLLAMLSIQVRSCAIPMRWRIDRDTADWENAFAGSGAPSRKSHYHCDLLSQPDPLLDLLKDFFKNTNYYFFNFYSSLRKSRSFRTHLNLNFLLL